MEKAEALKALTDSYERDVKYIVENLTRSAERKQLLTKAIEDGLLEPVLEYYNFVGSGMWPIYCNMPLNKKLFFEKINAMKDLGWAEDSSLSISKGQVSQSLRYGKYPDSISVHLSAVGEGVNCRLVVLEEGVPSKSAVIEWVCEEGAQEMEQLAEKDSYLDQDSLA